MTYSATYSPDDNKLRLYSLARLPKPLYERVRAAGFRWAPKQELFYAPTWTPHAEDLLLELCGAVGDADDSLMDRAEARAERFDGYSESRAEDAEQARAAVARIADHIPLGQPILVGHHSEKHARRDAEKIENGMRRAVRMWDTSKYWQDRAAAAIRHARYLERPDVRARRIKTIEADKRKMERTRAQCAKFLKTYQDPEAQTAHLGDGRELIPALLGTYEGGLSFEDRTAFEKGTITREDAQAKAMRYFERSVAHCDRWTAHYDNRLTYERAMLADAGGTVADRTGPEKGGAVQCWTTRGQQWAYIQKVNQVTVTILDNWHNPNDRDGGRNFRRTIPFDKLRAIMSAAQVAEARAAGLLVELQDRTGFALRDRPSDTPPPPAAIEPPRPLAAPTPGPGFDFQRMRDTLKQGVKVVAAPQLFPTPAPLAARMVELARIEPGQDVLEPSGGTGRILLEIQRQQPAAALVAVEIKAHLADIIRSAYRVPTHCRDFLQCNGELGTFDRIVMNPPFQDGDDIRHIEHAYGMLRPGGRLVALCANGPRQRAKLQPLALEWEDLPPGTFKEEGTGVNVALLVMAK